MRALQPWTGLTNLRKEMERLIDRFWEPDFPELVPVGEWSPRLDLSETKDALVVRAEIPGIEGKGIQVSLQDHVLTIKGEKKQRRRRRRTSTTTGWSAPTGSSRGASGSRWRWSGRRSPPSSRTGS